MLPGKEKRAAPGIFEPWWNSSLTAGRRVLLLQDSLPLPQPLSDGEAGDHAVDLGSPLAHVVLNVENKRLLAKVGVHNLTRGLEADGGVQVWLESRAQTDCG